MLQHEPAPEASATTALTRPGDGAGARRTRSIGREVLLGLGLALGASAVYSILDFIDAATRGPIGSQSTAPLNPSLSSRAFFDIAYNLLGWFFDIVPVLLALYLLATPMMSGLRRVGLDLRRPRFDLLTGLGLTALIGIPGLGLYELARALGQDLHVTTDGLGSTWYAVPLLVVSALRAALQEEVIVIGYLAERLRELRWRTWAIVLVPALLRGSYHLYQGWGGFVGNAAMGVVFGVFYQRFGRTAPLVIAHFILDVLSFVGVAVLQMIAPQLLPK